MAVGAAIAAPTISNMPAPYPLLTLALCAFCSMMLTFCLPPPGQFLPTAQKTGDHSVIMVDKQSNATPSMAQQPFAIG